MSLTREELLRELKRTQAAMDPGYAMFFAMVNTTETLSSCAIQFIKPTFLSEGWYKVAGEGHYNGLRGIYAKILQKKENESFAKTVSLQFLHLKGLLYEGIGTYQKGDVPPQVHLAISKAMIYAEKTLDSAVRAFL